MSSTSYRTETIDIACFPENRPFFRAETIESLPPKVGYSILKRSFDFFCAALGLVVFLIPMLLIALVICLDSPGNPIFLQKRLGKNQRPFTIIKFRTMYLNAEQGGAKWADRNDHRNTRVGNLLRNAHLDELPQLINILLGQMSFVGPRPERPEFYDAFDRYIAGYRQRMMVRPGLTGLAQVNGGYELLPEEKIVYDLEYIKNRSIKMDWTCIVKTVRVVFTARGAR